MILVKRAGIFLIVAVCSSSAALAGPYELPGADRVLFQASTRSAAVVTWPGA